MELKEQIKLLRILAELAHETDCSAIVVQIGRENYEPNNMVFIKEAPPIVIETLVKNGVYCFLEPECMRVLFPANSKKEEGKE
jgi:hypothetical protein